MVVLDVLAGCYACIMNVNKSQEEEPLREKVDGELKLCEKHGDAVLGKGE